MKLGERLEYLLLETPKITGNYKWADNACHMEEQMTMEECEAVEGFFNWLTKNKLTYGHGNLGKRWNEYFKGE